MRLLLCLLLLLAPACAPTLDDDDTAANDDDATADDDDATADDDDVAGGSFADPCARPADCDSGVCWDFADYDPWCGGTGCSARCESAEECWELASLAGAPNPDNASCGDDGICAIAFVGLGEFWCADGDGQR